MALATLSDLEARLGRDLTHAETTRAEALLEDVSASVVLYTGQTFALTETTIRLKVGTSGVVRLPQRPVVAVDEVKDLNDNDVDFFWDTRDRIEVRRQVFDSWSMEPYRFGLRYVDVTYEHGYEDTPPAIVGLICAIVLRTLGQDPTEGGTVSETIDNYSYRLSSASGAGAYGLLSDEKSTLDHYRRNAGGSAYLTGVRS